MEEIQGVLEKIFRKKGEESYISFKRGQELPVGGVRTTSDVFYLNDFYDLLYEKIESTTSYGEIPPQYFQAEKYYTMGPLCGALLYNENGETKLMFYDGNFSNVAGIDIFGNTLYSNEYGPNGDILYSINYSNISFACTLFDEDINSYIDQASGSISPFKNLSYSVYATLITKMMRGFGGNLHSTISAPHSVSWEWIMWMCGDSRTSDEFIDCALDVICGLDLDCMDEGDGGGNGDGSGTSERCSNPRDIDDCWEVCDNRASCHSCCDKKRGKCNEECLKNENFNQCAKGCKGDWDNCKEACRDQFPQ